MIIFLRIIAVFAGLSVALGFFDLIATMRPGATVFQQISARVDIGLSLIVFVSCLGFSAVLARMDLATATPKAPSPVARHGYIDIFKQGDGFTAELNGKKHYSGTVAALRTTLDQAS